MAVYAYVYSGYPESEDRKYYVGDYRSGNAYTYQVVPQLQREFDRLGLEDGDEIEEGRFEDLRRRGHLYTSNRSGDREPLYGTVERGAVPDGWRPLADWIAGDLPPGEVDWRGLGRRLREHLRGGVVLPEPLRRRMEPMGTEMGASVPELYERIRRRHVGRVWYDLIDSCRPEELEAAERDWSALAAYDARPGELPLAKVVRETRPAAGTADEAEWRGAMAGALDCGSVDRWDQLLDEVGSPGDWYDDLETAGGTVRVPDEDLYDLQWVVGDRLEGLGLHHECAPALEVDVGEALHARFHVGARSGVVVEIDGYPDGVSDETVRAEWTAEARSGAFREWSDAGIEALVALTVDPEIGGLPPGAPSSVPVAEFALWGLDDRLHRRVEESERPWRYSRLRDAIAVTAPGEASADALSTVVSVVSEALEAAGLEVRDGGVSIWATADEAPPIGGLEVSSTDGGVLPGSRANRIAEAARRAADREAGEADRAHLRRAHRLTGDLRLESLADPSTRAQVRALLEAVALREFHEAIVAGWLGDVAAGAPNR